MAAIASLYTSELMWVSPPYLNVCTYLNPGVDTKANPLYLPLIPLLLITVAIDGNKLPYKVASLNGIAKSFFSSSLLDFNTLEIPCKIISPNSASLYYE
mgnify:FL=1